MHALTHMQMSQHLRDRCHAFLLNQLPDKLHAAAEAAAGRGPLAADEQGADDEHADMELDGQAASSSRWGISPFFVDQQQRAQHGPGSDRFSFQAPTTGRNALRVLRALQVRVSGAYSEPDFSCTCTAATNHVHAVRRSQLKKPVLLEGSPGVGKTSLIAAMAKAVGEREHVCQRWLPNALTAATMVLHLHAWGTPRTLPTAPVRFLQAPSWYASTSASRPT